MADVFVCLSEHEGFCVPILEAMELDVPVVAYAAAAVPETVGEAGLLLDDKEPLSVAVHVGDLLADPARLEVLRKAGRARAEALSLPRASKRFMDLITDHLATQ
jgi:glycosyltransferase involved in cell wall biosynthesis